MDKRPKYMNVTQDETRILSGAWVAHPQVKNEVASRLVFVSQAADSETPALALARYDFKNDALTGTEVILPVQHSSSPTKLAMHPKGDGVVISSDRSCELFRWEQKPSKLWTKAKGEVEMKLIPSENPLSKLEDAGPQNCLTFNRDGSLFATGGEDGCICVLRWPSLEILFHNPKALKSVKDLDFSLDSAFLSATEGDNSACRVWELSTGVNVATLEPMTGEKFMSCRFSQDAARAFLLISLTKDHKGYLGVWDIFTWKRIGAKKFSVEPITALAVTHNGRRVAMGTSSGDIFVVLMKKMEVQQKLRKAHTKSVRALEFSLNDKALLSVSSDCTSRVTALDLRTDWKDWQIYLLFLGLVIISIIVFYSLSSLGEFGIPEERRKDDMPVSKFFLTSLFSRSGKTHEEL